MPPDLFTDQIMAVLENLSVKPSGQAIKGFLAQEMRSSGAYDNEQDILDSADRISDTIDDLDAIYKEIKESGRSGISRERKLRDILAEAISPLPTGHGGIVLEALATGLNHANRENTRLLGVGERAGISVPADDHDLNDRNEQAVVQRLHRSLQENTLLGIVASDCMTPLSTITTTPCKSVLDFLESPADDEAELSFKKAVGSALDIARRSGKIPLISDITTEELALLADQGATTAKFGYKVATGACNELDAIESLLDHSAARVGALLKFSLAEGGAKLGRQLGVMVATYFSPPAIAVAAAVGTVIGRCAGRFAGDMLSKGVMKIAQVAKKVVKSGYESIKNVASTLFASLFG